MLCGNSDENGNAIRDYDTAKRIRRRVTLQQKQFKKEEIEMQLFKIVFWIYSIRYIVTLQIYIYILN